MASRKLNTEGIDESLLLASIGKSRQMGEAPAREEAGNAESAVKPAAAEPSENAARPAETKAKPEPVRKKRQDYGSTFLKRGELKSRKSVYISKEVHSIISKIVNIADKEITVGGYIDTVLMRHLEENKDEINGLYRRDRDNLI